MNISAALSRIVAAKSSCTEVPPYSTLHDGPEIRREFRHGQLLPFGDTIKPSTPVYNTGTRRSMKPIRFFDVSAASRAQRAGYVPERVARRQPQLDQSLSNWSDICQT